MSLRLRLLVLSLVLVAAGLTIAGFVTYSSLSSFLMKRTDSQLDAAASNAKRVLTAAPTTFDAKELGASAPGIWSQLRSADGSVAVENQGYAWLAKPTSPALPATLPPLAGAGYLGPIARFATPAAQSGSSGFRVMLASSGTGGIFVLAASQQETEQTLHQLLVVEFVAGGIILIIAALGGMWLVKLGLRPLVRIEAAAETIAEENLTERLPGAEASTEVGRLARVLNTMLARLETSFTERKASEERLRQSEERLRRFAADASHELRTPIAAIRAYAELHRRRAGRQPDDSAHVMQRIEYESRRLGRLVDDLLLLTRLDEGRPLDQQPVDVGALAAVATDAATVLDPQRQIDLRVIGSVEVVGDQDRLRQLIDNLLTNVRTHTPPTAPVVVSVWSESATAILEVSDRGPGLSAEDGARVFERFYRADPSRARESGGAGLGLAIVAAITAAHGGTAAVSDHEGGGAVFRITLPLLVDHIPADHIPVDQATR